MAALTGVKRALSQSASLPTATILASIYLYARLQGLGGVKLAVAGDRPTRSARSSLASSRLARRLMRFQMRDGSRITCRIVDGGGVLSVHVDRDYDVAGLDWSTIRTIVDLGAHVGTFTVWAARRAPGAKCLAVEPNPGSYDLLVRNVRENGLEGRVRTVNAAIGHRAGRGQLELVEHSLGTRLARPGHGGSLTVDVVTLADALAGAGLESVDLMKVDIEGMEYEALAGLPAERLRAIRTLALEYHPEPGHDVAELERLLESHGFGVTRPSSALGVLWATK